MLDEGPEHGILNLDADGSFSYTPEANYNGTDTFSYFPQSGEANGGATLVTITVNAVNDLPEVGEITAARPLNIADPFEAEASFRDPDAGDTHNAVWDWGDGTRSPGTIDGQAVSGSHQYSQPGLYDVRLQVTDQAGESGGASFRAIVFDPAGGFATCGGWFQDNGKVVLTFNTRYLPGDLTPSGQVEIQNKGANINFKAGSQSWLVVNGNRAICQGTGTVNGRGKVGFLISALDSGKARQADCVRIKLWNQGTGEVIYDTQPGADDNAAPTTPLGGGNLVVHK